MIYMIRHGQTALNLARILQGQRDEPLSDVGRAQAVEAARRFREMGVVFDLVYSSPLCRASETARIIAGEQADIRTDPRLQEIDCGPWEGTDYRDPPEVLRLYFDDPGHAPVPPGMESPESILRRTGAFFEELRPQFKGKSVLIATHAIAMKGALVSLTPAAGGRFWSEHIGNCAVYRFDVENGRYTPPEKVM